MAKKEVKENKDKKHFFKDFKAELKKVSWPTPKQLLNNTTVVVCIVLITALIVFVLDLAFNFMHESGVKRLQTVVQEHFSNTSDNNIEDTESDGTETETIETEGDTTESESTEIQENANNENTSEVSE